jgi:hypothetical protein
MMHSRASEDSLLSPSPIISRISEEASRCNPRVAVLFCPPPASCSKIRFEMAVTEIRPVDFRPASLLLLPAGENGRCYRGRRR